MSPSDDLSSLLKTEFKDTSDSLKPTSPCVTDTQDTPTETVRVPDLLPPAVTLWVMLGLFQLLYSLTWLVYWISQWHHTQTVSVLIANFKDDFMPLIILFNILGNVGQLWTNYKLHTYTDAHIRVLLTEAGASEAGNHSGCEDRYFTSQDDLWKPSLFGCIFYTQIKLRVPVTSDGE